MIKEACQLSASVIVCGIQSRRAMSRSEVSPCQVGVVMSGQRPLIGAVRVSGPAMFSPVTVTVIEGQQTRSDFAERILEGFEYQSALD
jgi:hypothetical protein